MPQFKPKNLTPSSTEDTKPLPSEQPSSPALTDSPSPSSTPQTDSAPEDEYGVKSTLSIPVRLVVTVAEGDLTLDEYMNEPSFIADRLKDISANGLVMTNQHGMVWYPVTSIHKVTIKL